MNDSKFLIGSFLVTVVAIIAFAFFVTGKTGSGNSEIPYVDVSEITADVSGFDLGKVPIEGGIVEREYLIKNNSGKEATLKKIATSCMCTTAKVVTKAKETKFFGMEMHGDANPPVNLKIAAGETAKVITKFDPAAHGPEGTGPFDRIIMLYFSEPGGVEELTFKGEVVK